MEELAGRHGALTAGTDDDQLGVEREHRRPDVTGRVGVHERPADRAAVPDLRVGDLGDGLREQCGVLVNQVALEEVAVGRHRTDDEVVTRVADAAQRLDAAEVDEECRVR